MLLKVSTQIKANSLSPLGGKRHAGYVRGFSVKKCHFFHRLLWYPFHVFVIQSFDTFLLTISFIFYVLFLFSLLLLETWILLCISFLQSNIVCFIPSFFFIEFSLVWSFSNILFINPISVVIRSVQDKQLLFSISMFNAISKWQVLIHIRINLPLFSTVVPSNICMFLSCRPFVITTLSTVISVSSTQLFLSLQHPQYLLIMLL